MHASLLLIIAMMALTHVVMCYDEKYDKIDVDKILADDTLFTAYANCIIDKGPCDAEYSEDFKGLLPDVISTNCANCSPLQRQNVRRIVKALHERKPEMLNQLREKYDPKGIYEKEFSAFVLRSD